MSFSVELSNLICFECGCPYSVPQTLLRERKDAEEAVHCPNGHPNVFATDADTARRKKLEEDYLKLTEALNATRAELTATKEKYITARQLLEQAEAKLEEWLTDPPASSATPESGEHICPHCHAPYTRLGALANHLAKKHKDHQLAASVRERRTQTVGGAS